MELIFAGSIARREALGRCLLLKDNRKPATVGDRSPRHELLFANPIVDIWRVCFVANSYVFPLYRDMELTRHLTRPEFVTLFCLGTAGALVAQDIVEATGLPKNSISRAVKRLQERGLIQRKNDTSDKRRVFLSLSKCGERLYKEVLPGLIAREEAALHALTASERRTLSSLMMKIALASDNWA